MTDQNDAFQARLERTHSCKDELRAQKPEGWALSGYRQHGETWTCSCGIVWVHECDEAEGCAWWPTIPSEEATNE